ncbi:uncharacterized protein LOC143633204 [Bidens hawaiensis]|uniref:uncharacterized protein LOC143633204 n=1 Tax=Bidens hawaiensis TaxID=980011 RepID=UPI004049FDE3
MNVQGNMQPDVEMAHTTMQLPAGDIFDGSTLESFYLAGRSKYYDLYRASAKGDLEAAKDILEDYKYLVRCSITPNKETPLHLAIMSRNTKFVEYLVDMMSEDDLEMKNNDGNTAFCLAAISGNVRMAEAMLLKNQALLIICGSYKMTPAIEKESKMTPLCLAAFHGKREMASFLYDKMKDDDCWTEHKNEVLLKCIEANMLDVARKILEGNEELPQDKHEWDVLQALAKKPEAFTSPSIISQVKSCNHPAFDEHSISSSDFVTSDGILLLRLLLQSVAKKPRDKIDEILRGPMIKKDKTEAHPSQILFIAAKDNKQYLVELIREFPDLIWQRNEDGQTIFHIAVAHRDPDVYKYLKNIGSIKDFITPIIDKEGNNILHMVGKIPEKIAYEDLGITACEILHEYIWYSDVEGTLPPRYRQMKNKAGHTPEEFIKCHREVVSRGTDWIYQTINQSMVVAALVCTIGFATIYSIPGGFDQNNGLPIFRENNIFVLNTARKYY